jgi:hypothetical protein
MISLFITLFLSVFQPFGMGRMENSYDKYLFIGGYGLVTFFILFLDLIIIERIFQNFFKEKNWYLYKEIIWMFFVISTIGLGNVFYSSLFFNQNQQLTFAYIFTFQIVTFAVAIFPITIFAISKHNYLFKKHTAFASYVNDILKIENKQKQQNKTICLYSYNKNRNVEFEIDNLYFIEAKGNEIELHIYEDGIIVTKTLRNTLKVTLGYLQAYSKITQCHRAYIVNLSKIIKADGNSQGLLLKLTNCDINIPVSRSFVSTVKNKLS